MILKCDTNLELFVNASACFSAFRYAVLRFNQYFKMKSEVAALNLPE